MVEQSSFRGIIDFLAAVGVYDVILPFLLVFTIMFAILEKTKILGYEKIDNREYTKKNLNSMVAFIVAFLVIVSTKLVAVINEVMANVVLLVILSVCFLLLVGVFMGDKESTLEKYPGWIKFFMVIMFIAIVLIFLNALDWLQYAIEFLQNSNGQTTGAFIFILVILFFIWFVTHDAQPKKEEKKKD